VKDTSFQTPIELIDKILPEVRNAGIKMTGKEDLNLNFVFNSLISVDNAAWLLYAAENNIKDFDAMIPAPYKEALTVKNDKIAIMYQVSYGLPVQDIKNAVDQGYFVIKIKSGQPGSQQEMVEKDMARLTEIHNALKNSRTDQTQNEKIIYTVDPNGRYEKKETLMKFVDHAKKIGAFDQILLIEEPLTEINDENVSDIGIRITADESVHNEQDAIRRLEQGYEGMVLKGIAKTLSLSMKIAKLAHERKVPCFCADLTVNPILIDWNKNLAARLGPFPGLGMGMMETNGDVNYRDWQRMVSYHPTAGASWTMPKKGVFELNQEYYQRSGGIYEPSGHYEKMFK
jgi:L-alanine-DL-glutamate epimerase-like enolase superfamily enzyme